MQLGREAGDTLFVRGGPPMLLMAAESSHGARFALIFHETTQALTTLIHDWQPQRCASNSGSRTRRKSAYLL